MVENTPQPVEEPTGSSGATAPPVPADGGVPDEANAGSRRSSSRAWWLVVALLSLVAAVLRLLTYESFAFKGDEFGTLHWIGTSYDEILSSFGRQMTMHLYIVGLKAWSGVVGTSAFALKLPSLVAGVVMISVLARSGKAMCGPEVGLLAAVLATLNGALILYSRFARVYAILVVLFVLCAVTYWAFTQSRRPRDLVLFGLATAVSLASSLNAVCVLLFVGLHSLLVDGLLERRWRRVALVVGVGTAAVALALAFYWTSIPAMADFRQQWAVGSAFRGDWVVRTWERQMGGYHLVFLALWVHGAIQLFRRDRSTALLLVLWSVVPWVYFTLSRSTHPTAAFLRFVLPALPAQLLLVAAGAFHASRGLRGLLGHRLPTAIAATAIAAAVLASPRYLEQIGEDKAKPYDLALELVRDRQGRRDVLLIGLTGTERPELSDSDDLPTLKTREELTQKKQRKTDGRLFILTQHLPDAEKAWQRRFEVHPFSEDEGPAEVSILLGRDGSAGGEELRKALFNYYRGIVAAARAEPLAMDPVRHHSRLATIHRTLRRLAAADGDEAAADEYQEAAAEHAQKARDARVGR